MPAYQVRFINQHDSTELIDLYHLARTALAYGPADTLQYMQWASAEFHKRHPEVSRTGAYKDLCGLLGRVK